MLEIRLKIGVTARNRPSYLKKPRVYNCIFFFTAVGASDQPCTQTYAGPVPASEREAQAISTYVLNLKQTGNLLYYFAFHSYSQMILIPFSHVQGMDVLQVSNYADLVSTIRKLHPLNKKKYYNYVSVQKIIQGPPTTKCKKINRLKLKI